MTTEGDPRARPSSQNSFARPRGSNEPKRCFVLMPFDERYDGHYHLIKRTIETGLPFLSFEVVRVDRFESTETILRRIVENIAQADLAVADLSGNNPNVFYELGLAHGLLKHVILVGDDLRGLPFDLAGYQVLEFPASWASDSVWDALRHAVTVVAEQKGPGGPIAHELPGTIVTVRRAGEPLFWRRAVAFSLDAALVYSLVAAAVTLSGFDMQTVDPQGKTVLTEIGGWAFVSVAAAYFILPTWLIGQTLGKILLGIKVESADRVPLSFARSVGRTAAYFLDLMTMFVGFAMAAAGPAYSALHDRLSGTIVVRKRRAR